MQHYGKQQTWAPPHAQPAYQQPSQHFAAPPPQPARPPPPRADSRPPPNNNNLHRQSTYRGQHDSNTQLRAWFDAVDADRSGQVTELELKQALVNGDFSSFSDDTVKMLFGIFDVDRSGTIGFNEFVGLWQYIKDWQGVFRNFDQDRSGTMDGHELHTALSQFGYSLSPNIVNLLLRKYSPLQGNPGSSPPGINFDRFVRCCVTVRQLTEGFKQHDQDRDGWINISYETFLTLILSSP
ncbi:hypothetical protein JCM10207_007650 [Rhodosporidiobolus poonsookiae]